MRKVIFIIVDGMADRPCRDYNFKTPLEVANRSNLDSLAKKSVTGIVDVISPGVPPGTDYAHLAIFGYDPNKYYIGRGPLEALGVGLTLEPNDVAFRINFATVDDNLVVIDRRAGMIEDTEELIKEINGIEIDGIKVIVKKGTAYRGALVLRGKGLSHEISDVEAKPGNKINFSKPLTENKESKFTANLLNKLFLEIHDKLKNHPFNLKREREGKCPANAILIRGAGKYKPVDKKFHEKWKLKALCIAGVGLIKGIARYIGMDILTPEGATGTLDTDMMAKAKACIENLSKYDFIFVHVKATDVASHKGDFEKKVEMIEKFDEMVGYIANNANEDTFIIVTADHTTPIEAKDHRGDPVPIMIYGPNIRVDDVEEFTERACAKGGLCRIRGLDIMPIITDLLNLTKKYGA